MKTRSPLTEAEREKAKMLHASGKSANYIAKGMGRSHHTLERFLRKPDTQKQVSVQRQVLAGMFDHVAVRAIEAVTDEDVQKASLLQKMTAAGICVDKAMLLRNEMPPTIDVMILLDVVEAIKAKQNERSTVQVIEGLPAKTSTES